MKYFRPHEFDCECRRGIACNAEPMKQRFLDKLDALREEWGQPLVVQSGRRCKERNTHESGAVHSQHLYGNACDFHFESPKESQNFAAMARKFGFKGIGLGKHLVHIDDRDYEAEWMYSNK